MLLTYHNPKRHHNPEEFDMKYHRHKFSQLAAFIQIFCRISKNANIIFQVGFVGNTLPSELKIHKLHICYILFRAECY